ncbi:hypothetical protein QWY86_15625 [Pedobacter aquatilis]|uniref:hypothetical protein n=1 Tax=Pedobacter aquatilis TaxID=351343 RepID=UPI0025B447A4|nr:hypothetical protein [Pedobacter aquatilis]MDN3588113.1 hypothetical protein [Pedobacter aquatilis]
MLTKIKLRILFFILFSFWINFLNAQVTNLAPGDYKNVNVSSYNNHWSDYTRNLLLLHECFDGSIITGNFAIGTITALRGSTASWNRLNIAQINTSSAYNGIYGNVISAYNSAGSWKLKTCRFQGKKYLALEVPYDHSLFDHGLKFTGWLSSSAQSMLSVAYEVSGQPVNQDVLSEIADFIPNVSEYHDVATFSIKGNVGIGTESPMEKLSVNGKIRAHEIKVELQNWPDYVFQLDYKPKSLEELHRYIKANKHLPEIPSAEEVAINGVDLGEMNKLLLKKIEELTLHLIEKDRQLLREQELNQNQNRRIHAIERALKKAKL